MGKFLFTYVFLRALFTAGSNGFKLFLLTIAYSLSSLATFALVRVRTARALYPFTSLLLLINLPYLRLFTTALLMGMLSVHTSSVIPSLVSKERLGRVNSERVIMGSLGDLMGIVMALFIKPTWLYLAIPLYLLALLLPRFEYRRSERLVFSEARLIYLNSFLLGIAYSLTPALMVMWSRGGNTYELALIYSAPPISSIISGFLGRRPLKLGGRELIIAIASTVVMAATTGLMGVVGNPVIAWTLALTRWFFMAMFEIAITTFIQLRWRSDVLPGHSWYYP
ncbi:hypothetical protein [Vulcanisaeta souniana]|uniref:hypothetical protein n=1 Tax=Vulcanisaeta souniana TaxID=164452 RepID=UPI001FB322E5|nr:hypothetical protein [Vulcanisaeta souniana]